MGPLAGVKVLEIAGIGPGPFCGMLLADMGAEVVRVDRTTAVPADQPAEPPLDFMARGKRSVAVDLKHPDGVATVLQLAESADVIFEGFRPGVMERLGLGPEVVLARNPGIIYGRMTGWGQDGPLAQAAGHDMTYIATAGGLFGLGQDPNRPHFPMNLLGDFGGGSTYLVIGLLAALLESKASGRGQVVDAAIVDGTAHLQTMAYGQLADGVMHERRAAGLLDGGMPFYDVYETADGRHLAVGPLEPQFWATMVELLTPYAVGGLPGQWDLARHGELRKVLTETFLTRTMTEWGELFEGTDACVAPILTMTEAAEHPHVKARGTLVEKDGVLQPAPAPRFSRTAATLTTPPPAAAGQDTRAALTAWGITDVDALLASGAAVQP